MDLLGTRQRNSREVLLARESNLIQANFISNNVNLDYTFFSLSI